MKKKAVALLLACMLIIGVTAGTTLAWLTAETEAVENTFTVGNIELDIWEHELKADGALDTSKEVKKNENYHFVPGDTLPKDPWVVVKANSEACYLFIHVEDKNNSAAAGTITADPIIKWEVDEAPDKWIQVVIDGKEMEGYWYQEITSMTAVDTKYEILKGNQVTVSENVTKEMVEAINASKPRLTFTAAAVQMDNIADAATAWEQLPGGFKGE